VGAFGAAGSYSGVSPARKRPWRPDSAACGLDLGRLSRLLDSVKQDARCNDNHLGRLPGMIVVG